MRKEEDVISEIYWNIIKDCKENNLKYIDEKYLQDYKEIQTLINKHKINDEIYDTYYELNDELNDKINKLVDIIYKDIEIEEEENSL